MPGTTCRSAFALESVLLMRYNNSNTPMDNLRGFVSRGGIPVTLTLLTISIALFLASFFTWGRVDEFFLRNIAFMPANMGHAPWTFLTYPVYNGGAGAVINVLIGGFFLWLAGGSLERSWGSARYALFFFALTAITACSVELGWFLSRGMPALLSGFQLPLAGLIVAFCMLNAEQTVMFYFFPVKAKYVALIVTLLTYFLAGMGPLLNLFALGGILAAFLYVRFGRSWGDIDSYGARPRTASRGPDLRAYPPASRFNTRPRTTIDGSPTSRSFFDLAGRWKDYQERKRLEKLWKNSGFSDPEREQRDDEGRRRR